MNWIKYCCLIPCLFFVYSVAFAQLPSPDRFHFVDVKLHRGKNFHPGELSKDALSNGYAAVELRYGWHTKGDHEWEGAYNYPSYGIGWYAGYVGDVDMFGVPNALYGFMSFPLTNKNKRNVLMIEPALGLTFNLTPYDPETNPKNDAISSTMAVYFNMSFTGEYKLTRELDLLYGVDFTHFSNARTYKPNRGLNMAGFNIGARYHFNLARKKTETGYSHESRPPVLKNHKPARIHAGGLTLYQAFGFVQNGTDKGTDNHYLTSSTIIDWYYHFSEMHGITAGVDFFNDNSLKDTISVPLYNTYQTTFFPGAHIGYDFMWWRFTARLQVGYLLAEAGREMKTPIFLRPAIKFDFTKRFHVQVGVKSYEGTTADWLELGLGVKLFGR